MLSVRYRFTLALYTSLKTAGRVMEAGMRNETPPTNTGRQHWQAFLIDRLSIDLKSL